MLSLLNLAIVLRSEGDHEEAMRMAKRADAINKKIYNYEHPLWSVGSLRELGIQYREAGEYDKARQLLEKGVAIAGAENRPGVVAELGRLLEETGELEEARQLYEREIASPEMKPSKELWGTFSLMDRLARVYVQMGRHEDARQLVADLLMLRKKRADESAAAHPKNQYAWMALTVDPPDLQDPENALRSALEANELTEFKNASYLDTLALAYHRTGQTRKAIEVEKRAISLLPEGASRTEYEKRLAEFEAALRSGDE